MKNISFEGATGFGAGENNKLYTKETRYQYDNNGKKTQKQAVTRDTNKKERITEITYYKNGIKDFHGKNIFVGNAKVYSMERQFKNNRLSEKTEAIYYPSGQKKNQIYIKYEGRNRSAQILRLDPNGNVLDNTTRISLSEFKKAKKSFSPQPVAEIAVAGFTVGTETLSTDCTYRYNNKNQLIEKHKRAHISNISKYEERATKLQLKDYMRAVEEYQNREDTSKPGAPYQYPDIPLLDDEKRRLYETDDVYYEKRKIFQRNITKYLDTGKFERRIMRTAEGRTVYRKKYYPSSEQIKQDSTIKYNKRNKKISEQNTNYDIKGNVINS